MSKLVCGTDSVRIMDRPPRKGICFCSFLFSSDTIIVLIEVSNPHKQAQENLIETKKIQNFTLDLPTFKMKQIILHTFELQSKCMSNQNKKIQTEYFLVE